MVYALVIVKDSRILREERQVKKATEVSMPQNKENNEVLVCIHISFIKHERIGNIAYKHVL